VRILVLSATLLPVLGVPTVVTMHGRDVPGPGVPVDPGDAAADKPGRRALGERRRRRAEATFAWDAVAQR